MAVDDIFIVNYSDIERILEKKPVRALLRSRLAAENDSDPNAEAKIDAIEAAIEDIRQCELEPGVLSSPENPLGAMLQALVAQKLTEKAAQKGALHAPARHPRGGLKAEMDDDDLAEWIWQAFKGEFYSMWKFRDLPTTAESLDNGPLKIALLGDWGSGAYGAPDCATSVDRMSPPADVAIHMGDVYYIGNETSVNERFTRYWPTAGPKMGRALMGNHEAYAGGSGYFGTILVALGQSSSVFWLQNDRYILLGLDTGYGHGPISDKWWEMTGWGEKGLSNGQVDWLRKRLEGAGSRKVVLFSHHQPFTLFETTPKKLRGELDKLLHDHRDKLVAWYWGHEHRCVLFDRFDSWGLYGRCIGHSGYPAFKDDFGSRPHEKLLVDGYEFRLVEARNESPVGGRVLDGPNRYLDHEKKKYGPQGYAEVVLGSTDIVESLYTPEGKLLYRAPLKF